MPYTNLWKTKIKIKNIETNEKETASSGEKLE